MFRLSIWTFLLLAMFACAPLERPMDTIDCVDFPDQQHLLSGNWLQQPDIWKLRQSALLELGPKKIPLEGVLRLDTAQRKVRLVAMNEMGLVLFDLELNEQGQKLHRAMPQLQEQPGFAIGVAESLRRIFLQPTPSFDDYLQQRSVSQRIWRLLPGGSLGFIFDCSGNLLETRQMADAGDWQVLYGDYRQFEQQPVPYKIIFNDYSHRVKLSLWLREVKRGHE